MGEGEAKYTMKVYLAQYQGIGPLSFCIKKFTRSKWSHSAIVIPPVNNIDKFLLVEAWGTKGVVAVKEYDMISVLSANHRAGTRINMFSAEVQPFMLDYARKFILDQVGKKYDWALIKKFVTRQSAEQNNKWICSELAGEFFKQCGAPLQNMPTWELSPQLCGISVAVKPYLTITTA